MRTKKRDQPRKAHSRMPDSQRDDPWQSPLGPEYASMDSAYRTSLPLTGPRQSRQLWRNGKQRLSKSFTYRLRTRSRKREQWPIGSSAGGS